MKIATTSVEDLARIHDQVTYVYACDASCKHLIAVYYSQV